VGRWRSGWPSRCEWVLPALHAGGVPAHNLTYCQFLSGVSSRHIKTVTITSDGTASGTLARGL
jgi:hypothetical protein